MSDNNQLNEAFEAAYEFLNPVLKREEIQKSRGDSIVQILGRQLPVEAGNEEATRLEVIQCTLDLLTRVHNALASEDAPEQHGTVSSERRGQKIDSALEDAKRRRAIHAMLDLVSLEGIYPCLSQGVGIPLEQRVISVLPTGVVARQPQEATGIKPRNEALLRRILDGLYVILWDGRPGIQQLVLGRILPDITSGSADLAFNAQSLAADDKAIYATVFQRSIEGSSTAALLPVLSSFLQKSSAQWFTAKISSQLSRIPLRPDGVIQTIVFLASQFAPSLGQNTEGTSSTGPPITVQAIMQTSRLLSSVPQGMPAHDYFENIAPKLLALLDGDDLDLKKTASYVIGSGILGKRSYGAPGTVGYEVFLKPYFDVLNGNPSRGSGLWLRHFAVDGSTLPSEPSDNLEGEILIDETQLSLAIERLSALATLHPNPGLLKRLVHPVLLPLWALQCYAKTHQKRSWEERSFKLLQSFFSVSPGLARFVDLADNILYNGGSRWVYGPGQLGGISIRKREESTLQNVNAIETLDTLDTRIPDFLKLLAADPQSEELTGDIFIHVCKPWLLDASPKTYSTKLEASHSQGDVGPMLQALINAKFTEHLLESSRNVLSRHPLKVLEVISQIIEGESNTRSTRKTEAGTSTHPSIHSLQNIASTERSPADTGGSDSDESASFSTALSLLSSILTSPDFALSEPMKPIFQDMKHSLDALLPKLPGHLSQPATTASMLIEITLANPLSADVKPDIAPSHVQDLQTHRQALENLNSTMAPVQAEGLSLLSGLVSKSSPVLDIPSTLTLLLSLITNADTKSTSDDEFIYLNVIKLIGILASKHPRTVIKTLAERYADKEEETTLDHRLRLGEALLRTVEGLGDALVGDTAKVLGETMITVAGRRGMKPKAKKAREEKNKAPKAGEEDEDNSDAEARAIIEQLDEEMDPDKEDPAKTAFSANIIEKWAAGAASDKEPDDLRVRASAISILASAIRTNIRGLGRLITSNSVELALSTLTLEPGAENTILRRAAVVLLQDALKALDEARENKVDVGFGFSVIDSSMSFGASQWSSQAQGNNNIGNIPDILRVVQYVETQESDPIVRGHIQVLIESLEAWAQRSFVWREEDAEQPRFGLGDQLAGLNIRPLSGSRRSNGQSQSEESKPRIEEIE